MSSALELEDVGPKSYLKQKQVWPMPGRKGRDAMSTVAARLKIEIRSWRGRGIVPSLIRLPVNA